MKNHRILTVLGVAAVLSACQTTQTQPSESRFDKIDANKDGKLSRAEADDYYVTRIFKSRDKNDDGNLTWKEWYVQGAGLSKARFDKYDTNKDGSISLDEARVYGSKSKLLNDAFREADTDKDGYLSRGEAQAYYGSKEGSPY